MARIGCAEMRPRRVGCSIAGPGTGLAARPQANRLHQRPDRVGPRSGGRWRSHDAMVGGDDRRHVVGEHRLDVVEPDVGLGYHLEICDPALAIQVDEFRDEILDRGEVSAAG